jgi:adenylate cyclase
LERRLTAILAADVVGYSRLMSKDEAGTLERLKSLRKDLVQPSITARKGRIVKLMGDGLLAEFPSVVEAVQSAVDIQAAMPDREPGLPEDARIKLRIGVNLGDIIGEGSDIYGDGVNLAARLEGLASPGGICISGTVFDQVNGKIPLAFADLGEQRVKNFDHPVRVYRIVLGEGTDGSDAGDASSGGPAALELPDKPSIAVLPFSNMSGDPEQDYFADGITEDIITALSRVRWLFVIARNSTFSYKGTSPDVRQVSRDLGVLYVLEGSVRKGGNRIRITAQLIEATTGRHVWADRYDRDLGDVFALQDELTETLIAAIEPELSSAERERAIRKPPETLDAWSWFQRGLWHHYRFTKEDNAEAQVLFRKAIALDPNFSRALAALAHALYWDTLFGFTDTPQETLAEAAQLARKAMSLDDKEPFAYFSMGRIHALKGEFDRAIPELQQAIELNPSFAHAYFGLGFALTLAGRPEDTVAQMDNAIRLNPHDPSLWTFFSGRSLALCLVHQYEDAVKWGVKGARQANAGWLSHAILACPLGHLGWVEESRRTARNLLELKPDFTVSFIARTLPFKNPAHLAHLTDGLRKAGLPA